MARLSRLTLLRATFLALAALLLLPLYLLKAAIDERIAAQARLRHEVVAERIFDEFERELTRVVERETARPSSAYDSTTNPASWAPFIVGYFTANPQGARFTPRDGTTVKNRGAIDDKVMELSVAPAPQPSATDLVDSTEFKRARSDAESAAKASPPRSSPAVLQQLNVGREQRKPAPRKASKQVADPMQDYAF